MGLRRSSGDVLQCHEVENVLNTIVVLASCFRALHCRKFTVGVGETLISQRRQ